MNQKIHIDYLTEKGEFKISCSKAIFSEDELEILMKYGHWFEALADGRLSPFTELQKRFVEVAKGLHRPFSIEEKAWTKYCGRMRLEQENPNLGKIHYQIEQNGFFTDEDYYKMHPYKRPR